MRSPALYLTLLLAGPLLAAPVVQPDEVPHLQPTPPDKALATFEVRPGFTMELMAAEPLIEDPVAIAFDEDARLYVVEMRDYSERRDEKLGRVKLLEDTDGDSRYDKASIFAEGLAWPTGIVCWDGGVFVMSAPDLLYFKDMDGDRKADVHSLIFTGFGNQAPKLNVQALPNSLQWGPDQRIHGALGGNASLITNFARHGSAKIALRARDFSFDPRQIYLRPESGGGQFGMTFDETGRKFVCANSRHLMQVMYEDRVAAKVSDYPLPAPAIDIAADGPQAEVFRRSPEEAWRVIRTKWRTSGIVPGIVEGGGRSSGYFTSASGVTIYKGDAWPAEHSGDAFIADCGSNLIHRKKLSGDLVCEGTRAPGDDKSEFVASTDNWFRPVGFANAPDGSLWVIDIYREVIEHPWSLPEALKQHLDLNRGNDRGRLYRVVAEGQKERAAPRLSEATTAELVELLQHTNGWHRETAARLLHQRQDRESIGALAKIASDSPVPATRILALHVLRGLDALEGSLLRRAMSDPDADVRANAVRLAAVANMEGEQIAGLSTDASARVRAEVGWGLATLSPSSKAAAIPQLLERADSPWLKHSALAAAGNELEPALATLSTINPPRAAEFRKLLDGSGSVGAVVFGKTPASPRAETVAKYQAALALKGDAAKGRTTFEARCAVCHRFGKLGSAVGPDLDASRTAGAEKLLGNILEPSRELTAGYPTGTVETKSGELISGILSNETPAGVTLRLAGGAERIVRRTEVAKIERPAHSIMPEGLEAGLTEQEMADLLAFLTAER